MKPNFVRPSMTASRSHRVIAKILPVLSALVLAVSSCSDDPNDLSRYTSTAEYASDFIQNREKFSTFVQVVKRSNMLALLGTYGSYTIFAPTNDAFDAYLAGLGLSSIDELSQEDCDTITFTHIIEQAFFTTDYNDGTYPVLNMMDRTLTITCDSDTVSTPGEVTLALYVNKTARMIAYDDSVENGVVHTMASLISVNNNMLPALMETDSTVSLFYEAMVLTHMDDSLQAYKDETYSVGSDSIDWTNDALVFHTAVEYDNVAYMENRYFNFTVFAPQNSVLEEKYGVTDIEGLIELAHQCYDPVYPDDADIEDYTDRSNALNRFVSYHILDRLGTYYGLTCVDGANSTLASNWARNRWDIADWYETMMPYSILKCSFPSGSANGLYINRRGVQSRADGRGYKIPGAKVTPDSDVDIDQTAVNGVYHYIDDILSYGYHPGQDNNGSVGIYTQETVFTERLRIDCSTLSPDFMTSGARGHYTTTTIENGKYGTSSYSTSAATNWEHCLGFKAGSAKNFEFNDNTHVHVRPRVLYYWSYGGDEVTVKGRYDLTVKLPPVPAGDWELRMFTCVGYDSRGIVQFYIDDVPQGIPFDMRPGGSEYGWKSDDDLGDEEQIAAFDKQWHYQGWMKGPKSYWSANSETGGDVGAVFRDAANTVRRVIGTFHSYGKEDHYLRLQQKMESSENELNFDFIELCPSTIYNNPDVREDKW